MFPAADATRMASNTIAAARVGAGSRIGSAPAKRMSQPCSAEPVNASKSPRRWSILDRWSLDCAVWRASCDDLGGPLGAAAFPGRFDGVKKPGNPIRKVSRQFRGTRVGSRREGFKAGAVTVLVDAGRITAIEAGFPDLGDDSAEAWFDDATVLPELIDLHIADCATRGKIRNTT
jgi:hypothetical protein